MEMSVYLDASMLVPLFIRKRSPSEPSDIRDRFVVSDFAAAEFASALARRVRTSELLTERAPFASAFDGWTLRATQRVELRAADIRAAETFIRGLDLPLRTPDALHIAVAQRLGATLATFDEPMKKSATALGVPVAAL